MPRQSNIKDDDSNAPPSGGGGDISRINPSDDIGWRFATPIGTRHDAKCKFCGKIIKGGITRVKEHLAAKRGNVAPCGSVSKEVREEMMKHLKDVAQKKNNKQKRKEELETQLRDDSRGFNLGDDEDSDADSDPELAYAKYRSRQDHQDWIERMRGAGSSGGGGEIRRGLTRRRSVHDVGGRQMNWIDHESPEAKLREMDILLQKSKSSKQPKLNFKGLKIAREKLGRAISKFMFFNNIPFRAIESEYAQPMFDIAAELGKGVKVPTAYEISEVYLPKEYEEIKQWIRSFEGIWKERGVTIMCDGWTGPTRDHIINFLVYCNRGTIFHKSIDASHVSSRTTEYYFGLLDSVVEEIGESNVVQVVTDNEAALKAAGHKLMQKRCHLYWTACAAHCIDLMLHDISKKKSVAKVLDTSKSITTFIYNYPTVYHIMKKFTGGRELLRPAITRFATNFIALESIVKHKQELRNMFTSEEWRRSKWGRSRSGPEVEVKQVILDSEFWKKSNDIIKVYEPLVKVLRLVDGDEKPTMGFIYEAMDRAKLAIKNNCRYYQEYWKIIDSRWASQLHHDLHATGYFLNPQFQYGTQSPPDVLTEVLNGTKNVITKLEPVLDNQILAMNQLLIFRDKQDSFGQPVAQRSVMRTNPAEWWILHGSSAPELQRIAVKVLSQTTSSSNCERNWSTFSLIHSKTRNRLKYIKLHKLVFVHYNMRLRMRHKMRRSQLEIDVSFNPINLDYIFEEDDPLNQWLEEKEERLLDTDEDFQLRIHQLIDSGDVDSPSHDVHGASSSPGPSDEDGGLSPPSGDSGGNDGGGDDGDGHEIPEQYRGEMGIYGFRDDEEVGEPVPMPPQHPFHTNESQERREQSRRSRGIQQDESEGSSNDIFLSFGGVSLGESSQGSGGASSYNSLHPYSTLDPYGYPPQYPPQYPQYPPHYTSQYPPQFLHPPNEYQFYNDNTTSNSTEWDDDSQKVTEPARHSFWW